MSLDLDAITFRNELAEDEIAKARRFRKPLTDAQRSAQDVPALVARVRELEAKLTEVREIHANEGGYCVSCGHNYCGDFEDVVWPCSTAEAVTE